jgi:hypothetical protein
LNSGIESDLSICIEKTAISLEYHAFMIATHTSTASKFLILACLYLLLAPLQASSRAGSSLSDVKLVNDASRSFSDLRILCDQRPELCTSAAGIVTRVGDTATKSWQRIYDWALHASNGNVTGLPEDQA